VIEDRLLDLAQSLHTDDSNDVGKSMILIELINKILEDTEGLHYRSHSTTARTSRRGGDFCKGKSSSFLNDEIGLNTLLHTILSVRSMIRMTSPKCHGSFTEECGKIVVTISTLFPMNSLYTYWEFVDKALDDAGWEMGILHISEMLTYLNLNAKALGECINKVWEIFQSERREKRSSLSRFSFTTPVDSGTSIVSGNAKADKSDKHSVLLIAISSQLRGCILRWMTSRPQEFAGLFRRDRAEEEHMLFHSPDKESGSGVAGHNNSRNKGSGAS
jgi:hypothetical protein